jgi:tetratricopeptide (TPR) repeat protein
VIPVLLAAVALAFAPQPAAKPVTFSADVAPIIQSRCVTCHRPDGDAPFSLASFDDVRRRASMIMSVTKSRYMPPWKPAPGAGDFYGSRRMPDEEIAIIERWVQGGMAQGDAAQIAPATGRDLEWERGQPDLILRLPVYALQSGGQDVFRNFVVPVPDGPARIVRGMQFRPGNRAVHHANIRVDTTTASRRLDAADPLPGYEGIIARSADFPDGQFLGWTPGQVAPVLSDATAWQLPGGSDMVVQLHLRPTGATEPIAPVIGLYFGDRLPAHPPTMLRLGKQDLDVPPGASAHTITDSFVLPVAVDVLAIQPHAHYRARSVEAHAVLPGGMRRSLIRIDDWDINWQDRYVYESPVPLPAGTRLVMSFVFDNTVGNPRNPDRPPARSRWGWRSIDEMADVWIQVTTSSDDDRALLERAIGGKMLAEDAIGTEQLLEREPGHLDLRNDAAQIYMALGQPANALRHFSAVSALTPASAPARFNEGVALEALGRAADAATKYRDAIRLDPRYAPALNNAGALALRDGRIADARAAFERAVDADPANADAHANLGLSLIGYGESDAGLRQLERALDITPDLVGGLTPHVVLLAAHADASARRPAAAFALAERVARAATDRAAALDALAICHAALGRFDEAVQIAGAALSAAPAESLSAAIRARIALYQKQQPFVLQP